jgi:hypothetical protein
MTNFISLSEDGSSTEKMSLAQVRRENSIRYLKSSADQLRQFSGGMDMDFSTLWGLLVRCSILQSRVPKRTARTTS